MKDKLLKIINSYDSDSYYKYGNIPSKKLETAIQNYPFDSSDTPLALIDATVFGSAKNGMLIGVKGIYFKNDWTTETEKNFLSWKELSQSSIGNDSMNCILLAPDCEFNISGSSIKREFLIELLNQIVDLYNKNFFIHNNATDINSKKDKKNLTSDIGLNTGLQGSTVNYADNVHMHGSQGHGFAAEKMNNLYDKVQGKDAQIIGGDNAKNGADRIVDGINVQTKYCATGSRCVNECFDDSGTFRYVNQDGSPMQIEVPSDKYQDAINSMEDKIKKGKIPGINDPKKAKNIVRKGSFTYQQAKNMAQAGTIESLTYDAVNGVRLAGTSMGISTAISFAVAIWNGEKWDIALKNSVYTGLKVGGIAWVSSILTAQLGRTGLEQALRGTTDYLVKSMGTKATHFLANGLRSGTKIYGAAAVNNVSKLLRGNIVTGIATTLVLSLKDFYRLFNGQISGSQLFKNIAQTGAGVAGGIGGWMGGAAAGAAIGSAIPIVGTVVGGIIGGLLGSFTGGSVASKIYFK